MNQVKEDTLVKIGAKNKHDLLLEKLEETVALQEETKHYLQEAYEKLSLLSEDMSDVDAKMASLDVTFEESQAKATQLKKQISDVDRLARSLFIEWRRELRQYSNASLRKRSAENLSLLQKHYTTLQQSMKKSYRSMEPLISLLHDNQLYLKHNRSEAAIQSFHQEVAAAGDNMNLIFDDLDASIRESEAFADVFTLH